MRRACQESGKAAEAGVVWFDQEEVDSQTVKRSILCDKNYFHIYNIDMCHPYSF